jgi:hypothetical protein
MIKPLRNSKSEMLFAQFLQRILQEKIVPAEKTQFPE